MKIYLKNITLSSRIGNLKRLIRYKIYLQRSIGYLSIINSLMIFYLFSKSIGLPAIFIPVVILAGIMGMLILGYLDHRFILEKENELLVNKTPQFKKYFDGVQSN